MTVLSRFRNRGQTLLRKQTLKNTFDIHFSTLDLRDESIFGFRKMKNKINSKKRTMRICHFRFLYSDFRFSILKKFFNPNPGGEKWLDPHIGKKQK